MLTKSEMEVIREIRNSVVHRGYAPSIRDLMRALGYKSPRSISLILDSLVEKKALQRTGKGKVRLIGTCSADKTHAQTVDVPLVGRAPCGTPLLAEENIEAIIPVSTELARPPHRYFLLKAVGDSMDEKGINDGDLVLVRHQPQAQTGQTVVALIDNEATIKELKASDRAIVLRPRSSNPKHQPIVLTRDFQIQGVVVASIPDL